MDQTSVNIKTQVDLTSATVLEEFQARLGDIQQRFLELNQSTEAKEHLITESTGDILVEWESVDKVRSGKTTVKSRIRKLEQILIAEETSIAREIEQLRQINLKLESIAMEIIGKGSSEEIFGPNLDVSISGPQPNVSGELHEIRLDLEAEESRWLEAVESTNNAAMKQMTESEKVTPSPIFKVARR